MVRRAILTGMLAATLGGCAGLGHEALNVNVVGLEPLAGEGMEARFALKMRVQNPNDVALEFDGVALALDLRGERFATGVSDAKGVVPRFGETVLTVPVSVPVSAIVQQVIGFATGDRTRVDYRVRGRLAGPGFGSVHFDSNGEIQLPTAPANVPK